MQNNRTDIKKDYVENVMSNKHIGSDFTDFLKEDGIYEETNNIAVKRVIAYQLEQEMKAQLISKTNIAEMKKTNRCK